MITYDNKLEIVKSVCDYFKVTEDDLIKHDRTKLRATARHYCFYFLRKLTPLKDKEVADMLGRSRLAVIHSYNKINDEQKVYNEVRTQVKDIFNKINTNCCIVLDVDLLAICDLNNKNIYG